MESATEKRKTRSAVIMGGPTRVGRNDPQRPGSLSRKTLLVGICSFENFLKKFFHLPPFAPECITLHADDMPLTHQPANGHAV